MTQPAMIAADHIRQLTHPYSTTEWVTQPTQTPDGKWRTTTRLHTVHHPALLDQIEQTVTSTTMGGELFHATYGSKPAGRLDCLALLHRIETQSRTIATDHGLPTLPLRERLSRLAGAIGDRPNSQVKSWWATARVLTQHDSPPFAPDVPCPNENCEHRGTIRIRLDPGSGVCTECQTVWDTDNIGLLARWCAWAAEHLKGAQHWLVDENGNPVECMECVQTRREMGDRAAKRQSKARKARVA